MWESVKKKTLKDTLAALSDKEFKETSDSISTCMSIMNPQEWNQYRKGLTQIVSVSSVTQKVGYVMVSYNWGAKALVRKLRKRLADEGMDVWIDDEQMGPDSLIESMANAVEG